MNSKLTVLGHPVHPMLIGYPVAFYTATLVGFCIYAVDGSLFWLQLTIALNVAGVVMALVAAIPGFVDWGIGIPNRTPAKRTGLLHMVLNLAALGLFIASFFTYFTYWDGPAGVTEVPGIVLSAVGVVLTVAAGFQGWILIQNHHVGVRPAPQPAAFEQEPVEGRHAPRTRG